MRINRLAGALLVLGAWACDDDPSGGTAGDAGDALVGRIDLGPDAVASGDLGPADLGPTADGAPPDLGGPDLGAPDLGADGGEDMDAPDDLGVDGGGGCAVDEDCRGGDRCAPEVCAEGRCVPGAPVAGCCIEDAVCPEAHYCAPTFAECVASPTPGAVLVSELLPDPDAVDDSVGEWIEVHNRGEAPIWLDGWTLEGAEGEAHRILAADGLPVPPGGYVVLGRAVDPARNGGVAVAYAYEGFSLSNAGDRVALRAPLGELVDEVRYDGSWPVEAGASLSLSGDRLDPANDAPDAWCAGAEPWAEGADRGTPGAANPVCSAPDLGVDWCRLQWPLEAEVDAGAPVTVFGRVFEGGITDRTDGTDFDPRLVAEAGHSPDGNDPSVTPEAWTWIAAEPNPEWDAAAAAEPGNDEYQASFPAPAPGAYDLAYRVSTDGGRSWTYCDGPAGPGADGSEDGYSVEHAGALLTRPGPCAEVVCDAPPAGRCDGPFTRVPRVAPGQCVIDAEGLAACTYAEGEPQDCRLMDDQVCVDGACTPAPPRPGPGELVFTEILYDPEDPLAEAAGEWFELHNRTEEALRLDGCTLADAANQMEIEQLTVGAGGYLLFARTADAAQNGGLPRVDMVFGFSLNNGGETLILTCEGEVVDAVTYDDGPEFPDARRASIALDPAGDAVSNDGGAAWCLGEAIYFQAGDDPATAHRGTPGAANPPCPVADVTVDWCRLQFPLDPVVDAGAALTVYGRMYEAGLTDRSPGVDRQEGVFGQVGYGPMATAPDDARWIWLDAVPNAAWDGGVAGEPDNDEWQAELVAPAPGDYALAYRFTRDGGLTWLHCDRDAGDGSDGAEDGYQIEHGGTLTSRASPCEDAVCEDPPRPACDDDVRVSFAPVGQCAVVDDLAVCAYPEASREDCAAGGGRCVDGACVDLAPPPAMDEIVITELVYDPHGPLADADAEWVEVINRAPTARNLRGCEIFDSANTQVIDTPLVIPPGGYALFGNNADPATNGGVQPIAFVFGFGLNNGGDTFGLRCGPDVIDEVTYDDGPAFPDAQQASISLDPGEFDANHVGANWCLPRDEDVYFAGGGPADIHRGTPGVANPPCDLPDPCGGPCVEPPPADCADATTRRTFAPEGECVAGECAYGVELTPCAMGEVCQAGACEPARIEPPAEGEVIITEIMFDPHFALADDSAEWIEIHHVGEAPRLLEGCLLGDGGATVELGALLMQPGDFALFARRDDPALNGGLEVAQAFPFALGNGGDTVRLICGEVTVDAVTYDDRAPWPQGAQAHSLSLDPGAYDHQANDAAERWCLGRPVYFDDPDDPLRDNHGTPGGPNPACDVAVEFGRAQFPPSINGPPDSEHLTYGRVYHPGITDRSAATDPSPLLRAQAGFGPEGSMPAADPGAWTWIDAAPNAEYDGVAAGEADNDEYLATLRLPALGRYDAAWRFSADGGRTWIYADLQPPGSSDGYQVDNAIDLVVEAPLDPCDPNPCDQPPAGGCADPTTIEQYPALGQCAPVDGVATCEYAPRLVECPMGESCQRGACVALPPRPAVGEVILTEIMYDPHGDLLDANAEWLELHNTADAPRHLGDCRVEDSGGNGADLPVVDLAPGGYLLVAASDDPARNGGLEPDGVFGFSLGNNGDRIAVVCGGETVDVVAYDDGPEFPDAQAYSLSLDPQHHDAEANDDGAHWCRARPRYFADPDPPIVDNHGTPGGPNPPCDVPAQFGRLQFPLAIDGAPGDRVTVYGRLFHDGITNRSPRTDPHPFLRAQLGVGPDQTHPAEAPAAWSWHDGVPNEGYDGGAAGEPNNDEYEVTLRLPVEGRYDYAWRFSVDDGRTWLYADGQGPGSSDGYQIENAGDLTVEGLLIRRVENTGEVVITEVMFNPAGALSDSDAEWIELHNTLDEPLDLTGCHVEDASRAQGPTDGVVMPANGYVVLARSADPQVNGGLEPAATFPFALGNTGDGLAFVCNFEVDRLLYDGGPIWPAEAGRSMQLSAARLDDVSNDEGGYWCAGDGVYGADNHGTPGAPNRDCGPLVALTEAQMVSFVQQRCADCHTNGGINGDLNMDDFPRATYGVPAMGNPDMILITPGDRRRSYLWLKLSILLFDLPGNNGVIMPPAEPLPASTVERIGLFIDGLEPR